MNGTLEMHASGINNRRQQQRGFTLLEVLIAILVLSIGLLGVAQMQTIGIRSTHGAYLRTQATLLSGDMLDSMRANLTSARDGDYDLPFNSSTVTSTGIAAADLNAWRANIAALLPNGDASITTRTTDKFPTSDVSIAIRWNEIHQNETASQQTKTFTVDTTL